MNGDFWKMAATKFTLLVNTGVTYSGEIDAVLYSQAANAEAEGRGNDAWEYMAGDMNNDGAVNFVDAIQMLKASVGLELDTPQGPTFKAIDSDFVDDTMDEYSVEAPAITSLENVVSDTTLDLSIILTGDINGL